MVGFCFETVNWSPYFGFARPELRRMIRAAEATGFGWISFDLPSIAHFTANAGTLGALRDALAAANVKLLAVHSLAIDGDVAKVETLTREAMETCRALGAAYFHAGVIAPVDAQVVAATRRAADICQESGVGFAIEFLPFLPVASIGQTRSLLAAAGARRPGLVVDSWHFFNGLDDWDALAGIAADEIAYVQFDDHGPLQSDDLLFETTEKRVMPGEGIFDLGRFASTLRGAGFDGVVGVEILSAASRAQPIEEVARRMMDTSKPYWQDGGR